MIYVGENDTIIIPNDIFDLAKEVEYLKKLEKYPRLWRRIYINGEKTHYSISNHGELRNNKTKKDLLSYNDVKRCKNIYKRTTLRYKGKKYKASIHRLVAIYFCRLKSHHVKQDLKIEELVPNHKDGIKYHNAAFNLEWTTQKENTAHSWNSGLNDNHKGENCHLAKISEKQALQIIDLLMKGYRKDDVAKIMNDPNVTKKVVTHIRAKECWRYLTKDIEFPRAGTAIPYTLKDDDIHEICKLLEQKKYSDVEIAQKFHVSREYVRDIRNKKRRLAISQYYDF